MRHKLVRVWVMVVACAWVGVGCEREKGRGSSSGAAGSAGSAAVEVAGGKSFAEARKAFHTKIREKIVSGEEIETPPAGVLEVVQYESAVGKLSAYLSVDPGDGKRHPAIVWITGGDCNTIGDVWSPQEAKNDQSASQYRRAGIVMMYPSLRGGNKNPGMEERFFGEVDDVLAAADFLAKQKFVDPDRIYLGGHSSGGTLALLVAEASDRFRAVFSFGPIDDIWNYGDALGPSPIDMSNGDETVYRSPVYWLSSIKGATFVFEGDLRPANTRALRAMSAKKPPAKAHFMMVRGASHFTILAPMNGMIAGKILGDNGSECSINISEEEVGMLFK